MKIITLTEKEFDQYSSSHKYGSIYQTSNYANFRCENTAYKALYLGFVDNDKTIGATMLLFKDLFWGYKGAYAPRGLLINYLDSKEITNITNILKKYLASKKIIFLKINPPVVIKKLDFDGNVLYKNENTNDIMKVLKDNNYCHMGFNLYNENLLARFNAVASLEGNFLENFSKDILDNVELSTKRSIKVYEDESLDIDTFYDFIKPKFGKKSKLFYQKICNHYKKTNDIKIFYAKLIPEKLIKNATSLYDKEVQRNEEFKKIIESGDNVKYDMQKVLNDKIESDKLLNTYKKDIVMGTDLLNKYPDGIITNACMVIFNENVISILINYASVRFKNFNSNAIMIYNIMNFYAKKYKYIELGAVTGNFDKKQKTYRLFLDKKGFNSMVYEYIGEFDLVVKPLMYKLYLNKAKKKRLI